ncbi:MAG: SRPBCC family protein [Gemmatimonadaceae bacterium]
MSEILHQLLIHAPTASVYEAIATRDGLSRWWTQDVRGEPAVGQVLSFGFNQRATDFRMEVLLLEPDRRVRWRCLDGHPEWAGTEIEFALTAADPNSLLRFHHQRWLWRDGLLAQCSFDWARYLMSLRALVETGTGSPHTGVGSMS